MEMGQKANYIFNVNPNIHASRDVGCLNVRFGLDGVVPFFPWFHFSKSLATKFISPTGIFTVYKFEISIQISPSSPPPTSTSLTTESSTKRLRERCRLTGDHLLTGHPAAHSVASGSFATAFAGSFLPVPMCCAAAASWRAAAGRCSGGLEALRWAHHASEQPLSPEVLLLISNKNGGMETYSVVFFHIYVF
ncbi:uncharacterized protein LOC116214374 [Punica granatum]|uniref:Uncharacterized protein LOC116214374 n=1 Tax=Punica granatum TaxID=22663 RepID=A0A6P8EGP7_PUNGR|nr:uncharacterized protein LOC116214374 [Punica granatum]